MSQCLSRKNRYHRSVSGFHSGVVARLPNPSHPRMPLGLQWRVYLVRLVNVPDNSGWLVMEVIKKAILAIDGSDNKTIATVNEALRQCLTNTVDGSLDRINDAGAIKAKALSVLSYDTGTDAKYKDIVDMGKTLSADYISGTGEKQVMLDLHRDTTQLLRERRVSR